MPDVSKQQTLNFISYYATTEGYHTLVKHQAELDKVFEEVRLERYRQNLKFTNDLLGKQHHLATTWQSILSEECGEVAEEALNVVLGKPFAAGTSLAAMREEAVQCAAVAVAIIQAIDNNDPALCPVATKELA